MTRRDGNTALVAPTLALACLLFAQGWRMADPPGALAQTVGPRLFLGNRPHPSGNVALAARRAPLGWQDAAAQPGLRGVAAGNLPQAGRFGDVALSHRRVFEQFLDGGPSLVPFPSAHNGPQEAQESVFFPHGFPHGTSYFSEDLTCITPGQACFEPRIALRFGWWATVTNGDLTKVGEYQDLDPSPFYDADALLSDGLHTVDMFVSGLDKETTQTRLDFFGPGFQAGVEYQRYLHRRDHDPLSNMGEVLSGQEIVREDLNVGEDYAVRVQDVKTDFRARLGENIKLRLNFSLLRKHGERQANATKHCFGEIPKDFGGPTTNTCHLLSQRQRIDWVTLKFEPIIEAKVGPVRAEYSRPMRIFNQNDQVVTRTFGIHFPTDQAYAFVPENVTQVDRLKLGVDLAPSTTFYGRLQIGDTQNKFRQTHRSSYGFDLPGYFDVAVDRTRITGGFDWCLREHISTYFRYLYEDYEDKSVTFNSGTAHMFLAGLSAIY